ncbi:MAG: glycerophosphodiester phosphodiesterase [Planctomycetaceae bacterium]
MLSIPWCRVQMVVIGLMAFLSQSTELVFAVEIIAHRGASFDAPENTLASIRLAWKQNADAVEIDVYLSRDGHIVAVHDETTKRYGGPDKKIADQTLKELQSIDVGRWKDPKWTGEKIPTLAEILPTIPKNKRLFIEIKCGPEIIPELKRVLKTAKLPPQRTAIIGFSLPTMQKIKRALPKLEVSWIVSLKRNKSTQRWQPSLNQILRQARDAKLDGIDLSAKPVINLKYVQRAKQAGLRFYVWTVNSETEARRLQNAGVDGITTDRPGWLRTKLYPKSNR